MQRHRRDHGAERRRDETWGRLSGARSGDPRPCPRRRWPPAFRVNPKPRTPKNGTRRSGAARGSMSLMGNVTEQARSPLPRVRLIEREDATAPPRRRREQAAGSRCDGRLVIVEGPAGIGKSAVLAAERDRSRRHGKTVLSARCSELESDVSRSGWCASSSRRGCARRRRGSRASAGSAAAGLRRAGEAAPAGSTTTSRTPCCTGSTGSPLNLAARSSRWLLVVDDAQWCDRPSLRFLAYLAGQARRAAPARRRRVRGRGAGRWSGALLADLAGGAGREVVTLQPAAPRRRSGSLLTDRSGVSPTRGFAQACLRATGGNPLLLDELSRAMRADSITPRRRAPSTCVADVGPRAVSRTVLLRLARLDADAIALAQAVAVLGEAADLAIRRRDDRASRCGGGAGGPLPRPRADPACPVADGLRPPAPARRRLPGPVADRAAKPGTPRRPVCCTAPGRSAEQIGRTRAAPAARPPRAWIVDVLSDKCRRRDEPRAPPHSRRVVPARAPSPNPPTADLRADRSSPGWAWRRRCANAPAGGGSSTSAPAYAFSTDPQTRGRIAEVLARMLLFTRPPDEAVAVARSGPACNCRHELVRTCRDALIAARAVRGRLRRPRTTSKCADRLDRDAGRTASARGCSPRSTPGTSRSPAVPRPGVSRRPGFALRDGMLVRQLDPSFMTPHRGRGARAGRRRERPRRVVTGAGRRTHPRVPDDHRGCAALAGLGLPAARGVGGSGGEPAPLPRWRLQRRGGEREARRGVRDRIPHPRRWSRGGSWPRRDGWPSCRGYRPAGSDGDLQQVRGIVEVLLADGRWGRGAHGRSTRCRDGVRPGREPGLGAVGFAAPPGRSAGWAGRRRR